MVAGSDPGRPADVPVGGGPAEPVGTLADASTGPIEGRSLRQIAWSRLRRDRVALTGGALVILLILMAIFAPFIVKLLGDPPNEFHQDLIDPESLAPKGAFGGMSWDHLLGLEPVNGRDIFS